MRLLAALVACTLLVVVHGEKDKDKNANLNCPSGLNCRTGRYNPHPQGIGYAGNPLEWAVPAVLHFSNQAGLTNL
jgi:hypothetical protein